LTLLNKEPQIPPEIELKRLYNPISSLLDRPAMITTSAIASGGPYLVSSNWSINSDPNVLDTINDGDYMCFDVTAANSQVCSLLINGDPMR